MSISSFRGFPRDFPVFCYTVSYLPHLKAFKIKKKNVARGQHCDMDLDATKPVFRVSDKVRLKPVSSAAETS